MSHRKALQGVYGPSSEFQQRIDHLEKSFPDKVPPFDYILGGREIYLAQVPERRDQKWFVEYLDNVCSALDPDNPAYQECVINLARASHFGKKLPRSQTLTVSSLVSIPDPTPIGPYKTCYEGLSDGSKVFVKKLKPSLTREWGPHVARCFFDVVRWKYLTHSNIVPFLGITNKPTRLVSVWIPGINLTNYLISHPDAANPLDLLIGVASGLKYLHSCIVAHGDLGGPNIIIDHSGNPRITNFGLVAVFQTHLLDKVRACKRWAPPEALRRDPNEHWLCTDIFSFAMVIVEVFTRQIPFFPVTDSTAQSAIIEGKRPARPTHPDLTDGLWALVERCWDKDQYNRPGMDEVVQILDDCRSESTGKDRHITPPSGSSKTMTQNPTPSKNEPLSLNGAPKKGGSDPSTGDENTPILPSAPPSVPADWFSQITDEILDLTNQVASVALFGPIGVGKSFIAHATLDHDRTRVTFGDDCHFMRCDDLENSPDSFIKRLSEAIGINVAQLQSRLESSPPLMLVLDGVDAFLDPPMSEAEEIHALIEELGSYEHVCLVTTSRMYPDIRGFHRINIAAPPEDGARDIFYSLCDLDRSSAVDTLIARLDFHPLSIKLLASAIRENNWDEATLLKVWDDQTSVLREDYYQRLKDTVEPVFCSPTIKRLGAAARDVLGAIAAFPSGIEERQLGNIFHATGGTGEVIDVLCRFSLVSRRGGLVRMPSPFQFYFLESMLVVGKTGEVIKWGPDCMPAKAWLPIYTQGPPEGWTSDVVSHPALRQDAGDAFPRATPVFTSGPPRSGPSHTTSRHDVPARKTWIRRLPKMIKQRLLALFGLRIKPTILVELYEGPASIPPINTQEGPTDAPRVILQEDPLDVPSTPTQASVPASPTATQEDLTNIPPTAPQNDPTDVLHPEPDGDPTNAPVATPQQQLPYWVMPEAYDVW